MPLLLILISSPKICWGSVLCYCSPLVQYLNSWSDSEIATPSLGSIWYKHSNGQQAWSHPGLFNLPVTPQVTKDKLCLWPVPLKTRFHSAALAMQMMTDGAPGTSHEGGAVCVWERYHKPPALWRHGGQGTPDFGLRLRSRLSGLWTQVPGQSGNVNVFLQWPFSLLACIFHFMGKERVFFFFRGSLKFLVPQLLNVR